MCEKIEEECQNMNDILQIQQNLLTHKEKITIVSRKEAKNIDYSSFFQALMNKTESLIKDLINKNDIFGNSDI